MKTRIIILIFCGVMLTGQAGKALAGQSYAFSETPDWLAAKGREVTLLYPADTNLRKLESRLRSRYFSVSTVEKDLFANPAYRIENRITARLESILLRAKRILAMNPPYMNLKIKVFNNREELNNEYYRIFGSRQNYRSFYIHNLEMIFSSMQDITDSVIAHEMGHAIIDHYFNVTPPPKVAELLAVYVDSHLEKE
ncbi:MAG: hypothetical protein V1869_02850 [Candidatus Omnitrophota bacterium]